MSFLNLDDKKAYRQWADSKHALYDRHAEFGLGNLIDIDADGSMDSGALFAIKQQIDSYNFSLYRCAEPIDDSVATIKAIGAQAGLKELDKNLCAHEDRLTRLTVQDHGRAHQYIPYSNKAIGWHTDGYYNPMHQRVQAMVLHCEQPAADGGVNDLLDHDMAYIHLRDIEPRYIEALSQPEAMCIPENVEDGVTIRPTTCSAVFLSETDDAGNVALAMRYSRRKRNILWADDNLTREAVACLEEFLDSNSPWHIAYRLKAGEGVLCNNVLHTRSAFTDDEQHKRVYYRARYYNRIQFV
jgi:hypothetical protein